jgi:hypothetical protein
MNCRQVQRRLPGYLDGAVRSKEHARVHEHLETCGSCRRQLESYRRLALFMSNTKPVVVPADLALRIRVETSRERQEWGYFNWLRSRAKRIFEDILEPVAIPATGGVLTALVVFVLVVQNILVGVPLGGFVPNDLPLNQIQPARLESLAPFPPPGLVAAEGQPDSGALLLEATLNAQGEVVSYKILSGPNSKTVQRQIDQVLMFSHFRPQFSFGQPADGGRVLLSFNEVRVRG